MQEDSQQQIPALIPEGIVVNAEGRDPALLGGYCPACRDSFFPMPKYCPRCLEPAEACELNGEGIIYSHTAVRARPPLGLPQPYAVGYIDLAESGLRIFGLLDPADVDRMAIGRRVILKVGPLGVDNRGEPCLRPYFSLAAEEKEHG